MKGKTMSSGMNREQAEEYAKTMTYKQAISNIWSGKGIKYRKATMIKLHELAEIADKLVLCKDCYWYDKGKNDCDSWEWCKRHKFDSYDEGFCSWATHKKQVTSKLKNPCDSLLTEDPEERKEQKSKLDLIRREDVIDAIDDAIDANSPQWAILRTKIGFLPSADKPTLDEVVRCKDCEYWKGNGTFTINGNGEEEKLCKWWSKFGTIKTAESGFCSYGERREP